MNVNFNIDESPFVLAIPLTNAVALPQEELTDKVKEVASGNLKRMNSGELSSERPLKKCHTISNTPDEIEENIQTSKITLYNNFYAKYSYERQALKEEYEDLSHEYVDFNESKKIDFINLNLNKIIKFCYNGNFSKEIVKTILLFNPADKILIVGFLLKFKSVNIVKYLDLIRGQQFLLKDEINNINKCYREKKMRNFSAFVNIVLKRRKAPLLQENPYVAIPASPPHPMRFQEEVYQNENHIDDIMEVESLFEQNVRLLTPSTLQLRLPPFHNLTSHP